MSRINFMGTYSGIDMSVIDQMMAVEKRPLIRMSEQKTTFQAQKGAWRDVNTRLNNLRNAMADLGRESTYMAKQLTVSNTSVASATASADVLTGTYRLDVAQLATQSRVQGGDVQIEEDGNTVTVTDSTKPLGLTGEFVLQSGDGEPMTIKVESTYTLRTVARAINQVSDRSGVQAAIIDNKLVLQSTQYGQEDIRIGTGIQVNGEGENELIAFDGTNPPDHLLHNLGFSDYQTALSLGDQARFSINGGTEIVRNTNVITDAVQGMTIQLLEGGEGVTTQLRVQDDTDKVIDSFKKIVEQYNSTMTFLREISAVGDPDVEGSRGKLYGESTLVRLQSSIRGLLTERMAGTSSFANLSELGIQTVDETGVIRLDEGKLRGALQENPRDVMRFFNETVDGEKVGFHNRMNETIIRFTDSRDGIIKSQNDSIDRALKDLNGRIDNFQRKMDQREEYYVRMFSRLEAAMFEAESQANWLNNQLGALQQNNQRR